MMNKDRLKVLEKENDILRDTINYYQDRLAESSHDVVLQRDIIIEMLTMEIQELKNGVQV